MCTSLLHFGISEINLFCVSIVPPVPFQVEVLLGQEFRAGVLHHVLDLDIDVVDVVFSRRLVHDTLGQCCKPSRGEVCVLLALLAVLGSLTGVC